MRRISLRVAALCILALTAAGCAIPYAVVGEGGSDAAGTREFGFIPRVDASETIRDGRVVAIEEQYTP